MLDAITVIYQSQQPQLFELEYKSADGCVGCAAEIFRQLFGRKLAVLISGEDKLPQGLFFFRDIAPAKAFWNISVVSGSGKTGTSLWYTFSMK